ncbi:MAG: hypothetical protein KatS3mg031_2875 [Chitinophagales bacterium]|nr:MAG: hypothetical protein KatS3mg031_2875 [Chitinophagales bacterium]
MKTLKEYNPKETYRYVVRYSLDPAKDLERNWSTFAGAECEFGPFSYPAETEDEAREEYAAYIGISPEEVTKEFRWHNGLNSYAQVHYEGLGAWELNANTLEEAVAEAKGMNESDMWCTTGAGTGHFFASEVVAYIKVPNKENLYIFILD